MTHVIVQQLAEGDFSALKWKVIVIAGLWVIVLAAMVIDFASGVYKAKQSGLLRTSYGYRRTVTKAIQYFALMAFMLLFDTILSLVISLPVCSMLGATYLVFVEAKSVWEKADMKVRRKASENLSDLMALVENKNELSSWLLKVMKEGAEREINNTK